MTVVNTNLVMKQSTSPSNSHSYIEVGDQKFISLSSDGLGTNTWLFLPPDTSSTLIFEAIRFKPFPSSSAMYPTDCDKFCLLASKFDKIQLPWWFSVSTKGPVKYLFTRRMLFGEELGEVSGDAGRDLLPLLNEGLKPSGGESQSFLSMLKPRITFPATIWCATRTTEEPHIAASPLKPSSTPLDFVFVADGNLTCWAVVVSEKKRFSHLKNTSVILKFTRWKLWQCAEKWQNDKTQLGYKRKYQIWTILLILPAVATTIQVYRQMSGWKIVSKEQCVPHTTKQIFYLT